MLGQSNTDMRSLSYTMIHSLDEERYCFALGNSAQEEAVPSHFASSLCFFRCLLPDEREEMEDGTELGSHNLIEHHRS